jgi:RNA polymerase sigma-70 factor (ECF subfamily)
VTTAARADEFEALRPHLLAVAYRLTGTYADAEDIVQDAWIRWDANSGEIHDLRAWLTTVVSRLGLDRLRSAARRRETYVGEWLPEPVTERPEDDPARQAELADSLSLAFLVVLESLSPEQRAAFLLHDVFDYDYDRVADIVGTSEVNARKLASRARHHVDEGRTRFDASEEQRKELAASFFAAIGDGDFEGLEALLAEDVELHGDGGGIAPAIRHPIFGKAKAAQTLRNWGRLAERIGGFRVRRVEVNGQPGAEFLDTDGRLINVMALDIAGGKVQTIRSIVNPEKLGHLGPLADIQELFARIRGSG